MTSFKFVLLFCRKNNGYLVILDMTDEINNHPLYEAIISDSGKIQYSKILPNGISLPFNYSVAIDAIDHIQSVSQQDFNRILTNQLAGINEAGWAQFDQDCYQYIHSDLNHLLEFGLIENDNSFN